MKTKNIFKTLAFAMLMPAMLLTASCSSEDDLVNNTAENTEAVVNKGYTLPVTVNVTRQGDEATTRATYNESTKKLAFSEGDKLFVSGCHETAGTFAGTLDYNAGSGNFSGTIYTENLYEGTADALFSSATSPYYVAADLLPNGYKSIDYVYIYDNSTPEVAYDDLLAHNDYNAITLTKAAGVEQLSFESADHYDSGFALAPKNAILNFTITGLTASTEVAVVFTDGSWTNITGSVTTDASGTATFAIGVANETDLNDFSLTVGGTAITLVSESKTLSAGKIYNISRSAAPAVRTLAEATAEDIGKVIGADGKLYATKDATEAAGTTASAIVVYVGSAGSVETDTEYRGLALALTDATDASSTAQWYTLTSGTCVSASNSIGTALGYMDGLASTNTLVSDGHTHAAASAARNYNVNRPTEASAWFLPSIGQWNKIVNGLTGTTTAFTTSTNDDLKGSAFSAKLTDAGGSALQSTYYWSSTECGTKVAWYYDDSNGYAYAYDKTGIFYVRAAFAF